MEADPTLGSQPAPQPLVPEGVGEQQPGPEIKAIRWRHNVESNDAAVSQAADCDVLAFEHTAFKNADERAAYNSAATVIASDSATDDERRKAWQFANKHDAPVHTALLSSLEGSGKRIVTLDMDRDDPNYSHKLAKGTGPQLGRIANAQSVEAKSRILNEATESGTWDVAREARMVEQVHALAGEYKGQDVKIGVLIGGAHSPVFDELAASYPIEYANATNEGTTGDFYYDPVSRLRRARRIDPQAPVTDADLNRALLQLTHVHADVYGVMPKGTPARSLENLIDGQVSELVLALDGVKASVARMLPILAARKMGKMMHAAVQQPR